MMKSFKITAFLLSAATLLLGGYFNLVKVDNLEIRLYEVFGFNWLLIPFVARILTASCFFIPVLLLLGARTARIISVALASILFIIILSDQFYSFSTVEEVEDFNISASAWLPGALSLVALAALWLLNPARRNPLSFRYRKVILGVIGAVCIALPFITTPLYPADFRILKTDLSQVNATDLLLQIRGKNDVQLYCFYTPNCPYCKKNSKKIYLRLTPELRQNVFSLFLGQEEHALEFFEKTHTHFEHRIVAGELFKEYKINRWPGFILVKDGKAVYQWDGNTFNYAVLNELPRLMASVEPH